MVRPVLSTARRRVITKIANLVIDFSTTKLIITVFLPRSITLLLEVRREVDRLAIIKENLESTDIHIITSTIAVRYTVHFAL